MSVTHCFESGKCVSIKYEESLSRGEKLQLSEYLMSYARKLAYLEKQRDGNGTKA